MKQFYVYLYRDPKTDTIVYVGKGQDDRAFCHIKFKTKLGNVLRKRTAEGFIMEPQIFIQENEETAFAMEIALISWYGRENLGTGTLFNRTDGGEGMSGMIFTDEHRKKLSKAHQGKKLSAEHSAKIGASNSGKKRSAEIRAKISERQKGKKGKPTSEETKQLISAALTGKKCPPEVREKLRIAALAMWANKRAANS